MPVMDPNVYEHTISRPAAAATADKLFVVINGSDQFALASEGGNIDGVSVTEVTAAGDELSAFTQGVVIVKVGAAGVTAGVDVMVDAASKAASATAGKKAVGRALETVASGGEARIQLYERSQYRVRGAQVAVAADGAIAVPSEDTTYFITKAGVAAMTLVDPTADTHDGIKLTFVSVTAQAHTLSNAAGSGFNGGGAGSDLATFGGAKGDGITIIAYQGDWYVIDKTNVTLA